ncbi:Tachykinin-like peptides receptor 86C [Tribolium castaneum]|uniref:Tachykinin-like peptides receptor 86C n=1 Tax=Tribolium castaneum TaxID=7070 RepID=D6WH99_TRICA|nr:PREDICTED: substance-P receptor [Tribolium castaneum]EFA01257.2 Tachykinin-like peptides receptor 86C [Tribolium castaneum]|eukprot:XP_008191388.1 PREDICTED: substance-P receptor [Tribolium castaneum]
MGNHTVKNDTSDEDYTSSDEFDPSNHTFINEKWIIRSTAQIAIESSIFAPIVLFGIFGNFLSIYVLVKNRHICTPTNLLIGNMAAADLLSLLIHPWVFLIYDFFQNYQFGSFGCKTEAAVECSILLASVISVTAISYDRLTAIVLPQESKLTKRGAKIVMVATWVTGILLSTPFYIYRSYKERQWLDFLEKYCTENTMITNIYWHVIITVLVWLPLTIQLICYITIFIKLNKYEKVVRRNLDHRQVDYKKKAVRMMVSVILTFLICRLPFTALIFYRDIKQSNLSQNTQIQNMASGAYHNLWFASKFFIFVNSALNPLIYSVTNDKFRRGFRTTKLSKWLFPREKNKPKVASTKPTPKLTDTSMLFKKKNIFLIFKKKKNQPLSIESTVTSTGKAHLEINKI